MDDKISIIWDKNCFRKHADYVLCKHTHFRVGNPLIESKIQQVGNEKQRGISYPCSNCCIGSICYSVWKSQVPW